MDEQTTNLLQRVSRYILIGVTAVLVLLLLLALLRVSIGFWLWSTVETWATVRLGLNTDAAQLVTVILVSLITLLLPTLAWYFWWGKKQLWATGAVVGGQILIFLLVSTIGSNVCFDRTTGESLCWYADIPGKGRVISRTKGFDPETGTEFKQYTKEIALKSKSNPVIADTGTTKQTQSVPIASRPNCVVSYSSGSCWTITPPTTRCSGFSYVSPKATVSSDGLSCTLIVPSDAAQGVRAIDNSGQKFSLQKGDKFEISATGQIKFSNDHPCVSPEGMRGWYDPYVDSPFNQNVGGLEFSIGNLNDNRFFAGSSYSGVAESSGVPVFRIVEQIKGYSDDDSGAFTVTVKKVR